MRHLLLTLLLLLPAALPAAPAAPRRVARWIAPAPAKSVKRGAWIAYQKDVSLPSRPRTLRVRIACDSKYWLWIDGRQVVFEGQLKRGPAPGETYYDEVDLAPWLHRGSNRVAVLVWYFGRSGFSHADSGQGALIIDSDTPALRTDSTWLSRLHPAYAIATGKSPNFRISEPNILFDARHDLLDWQTGDARKLGFHASQPLGAWGDKPWGTLRPRPIPQWRDGGVRSADFHLREGRTRDTITARLPGNLQVTPVIELTARSAGDTLDLYTNHSHLAGTWNNRAQYVTRDGRQRYESLGWMNGEEIILYVPHGTRVHAVDYRETGYDTRVEGSFECDSAFFDRFWQKALATLYVNMRDSYMDCPERERAQWWGDEVVLTGEAFYTLSTSAHALMRKGMLELAHWQRADSTLHAPVPGNYESELPGQMLAAIGPYGFWNYYMNTADLATMREVYPAMRRYLTRWRMEADGMTAPYTAKWLWGDWGDHRDMRLLYAAWYYMALESAAQTATLLGLDGDATEYRARRARLREAFDKCWTGYCYRYPQYMGATDDRAQALAVVAGLASEDKYDAIFRVLQTQEYASPYMEKYVMEALFLMGRGEYAMQRFRRRIARMVDNKEWATLFEFWDADRDRFRHGSSNHAWSGGALTVIARQLLGVRPTRPAYEEFEIDPQYVYLSRAAITIPTLRGMVETSFCRDSTRLTMTVGVPRGSRARVMIPSAPGSQITVDGQPVASTATERSPKTAVWMEPGRHEVIVRK